MTADAGAAAVGGGSDDQATPQQRSVKTLAGPARSSRVADPPCAESSRRAGFPDSPLTPPDMRTHIRRFAKSLKQSPSTTKHKQTLPIQIRRRQSPMQNRRLRDPPIRTTAHTPLIRQISTYPKRPQHAHLRPRSLPFLPTDLAHPTPKPLIQVGKLPRSLRKTEVPHPTPNEPIQLRVPIGWRLALVGSASPGKR